MAASLSRWLLKSNIVIREGPHKGAVAGWLGMDGLASFAYPEITGYYLSWLSTLGEIEGISDAISIAGSQAIDWFCRIGNGELPLLTRYHLCSEDEDWRNLAIFSFDLAMAARGISDSNGITTGDSGAEALQYLLHILADSCTRGEALPVHINARGELPSRWSTRAGPFQLKSAAAILFSVKAAPKQLRDAAWNTYDRWRLISPDVNGSDDLHPALYALEGLLEFGRHEDSEAFELAAVRFHDVVSKIDRWPQDMRSDVIAQALRLSCLLGADVHRIAGLRRLLETFMDHGRVSFRPLMSPPVHWNAWSAMFAYNSIVAQEQRHLRCGI